MIKYACIYFFQVYFVMGGLDSYYSSLTETAVDSAQLLVKGDSKWRMIASNGWQESWPVYAHTGITMNSKIYFFGMLIHKSVKSKYLLNII